jgi:DNA modification methylase
MQINCAHDELVDIDLLTPNPRNANKHPEKQIKLLAKIMKHQGWRSPVVVSRRSGFIVKGHGRLEAAKLNGWDTIPVDHQEYANEADEYADMVADNKIAELADTDLSMVLEDVLNLGPDFDLDLLGIPDFKLPEDFEPQADEDDVPGAPVDPTTKRGDIWQLGRHRMMCGDATLIDDVSKLMDGKLADLVITDPPYNVAVNDESEESLKARNRRTDGLKIQNDKMSVDDFEQFLFTVFTNYFAFMRAGAPIYIFYADSMTIPFMTRFAEAGFHFAQNCIWNKQQFVMTRKDYHYKHEPVMYGWKLGTAHPWHTDRKQSSVWDFDRPFKNELHPTMKPITLLEYPMTNSSKQGDLVLDLFGGSGSTLVAAQKTGRTCNLMEIDPFYSDVIIRRFEEYSGQKAQLINGRSEI